MYGPHETIFLGPQARVRQLKLEAREMYLGPCNLYWLPPPLIGTGIKQQMSVLIHRFNLASS